MHDSLIRWGGFSDIRVKTKC